MLPGGGAEGTFTRLGGEFRFACHPGVACFNQCCRRLHLVLTPYDLLRLKRNLGLTSRELLDRYCQVAPGQNGWPQPSLAMRDSTEGECPLLGEGGCTVYPDRPGACRAYPLGRAVRGGGVGGPREEELFLVREAHCQGFAAGPAWTPEAWTRDQGLAPYFAMNDRFLPLLTRQAPDADAGVIAKKMQMFALAMYNLESFRDFVFHTRLRELIDLPAARLEQARQDDEALLALGFAWLGFAIFGDPTLALRRPAGD